MSGKRTNKQSPAELNEEAIALIHDQGYSVAEAPKSLRIGTSLLYKWKEKHQVEGEGSAMNEDKRTELKRLRHKVKTLRMKKII